VSGPAAEVEVALVGGTSVVDLRGEVDLENALSVEREIADRTPADGALVVDLGGVAYMDSYGVRLLESLLRRAVAAGGTLALVVPDGSFAADVVPLLGLADLVPVHRTVDEALAP
jgi:anti-anti-sigma factor